MAGIRIEGNVSGNVGEVDANNQQFVVTNTDPKKAGAIRMFSENDPGAVTGAADCTSPETSQDYRLRVGIDTMLFQDNINYAAQDTSRYRYDTSTLTVTWPGAGGGMLLNGAGNTASGSAIVQTRQTFGMSVAAPLYIENVLSLNIAPPANFTFDFGIGLTPAGSAPYAPTDGVYFRITSAGVVGYINPGSESPTGTLMTALAFGTNITHRMTITIDVEHTEFWIDDVLCGKLPTPAASAAPFLSNSLPMFWRVVNNGVAGGACTPKVTEISASWADFAYGMTAGDVFSRMGSMAYQGQGGQTVGSTAQWAVQADPATATVLSPLTPQALGLGGQARFLAPATGTTEGIIFSYLNSLPTTAVAGKALMVSGVKLSCVNLGVSVNTTATVLAWSIAYGNTLISLTGAEAATTKAPRRIGLGFMTWPIGALVGTMPDRGDTMMQFINPITVNPGEYFQIACKCPLGTATSSQNIWTIATVDAKFV